MGIEMVSNLPRAPTEAERRLIQEIIDRHDQRPAGVRRVEFEFGKDWTGDPAVHLAIFFDKNVQPTKKKIAELNDFIKGLLDEIIDSDIIFWPYARIFEE
jgi:hypothetical protein